MELYIHKLKISRNAKESFKKFLDPDCYPDNLKISSKSVHNFLIYVANKQTHKQTNPAKNINSLVEVTKDKTVLI